MVGKGTRAEPVPQDLRMGMVRGASAPWVEHPCGEVYHGSDIAAHPPSDLSAEVHSDSHGDLSCMLHAF